MHAAMLLILIAVILISQVILFEWKKRSHQTYLTASLIALWIIPAGISFKNSWWRFIIIWLIFTTITAIVLKKSFQKPVDRTTPRLVYKWFLFLYKLSYGLGIIGYIIMMATFIGINLIFGHAPPVWMDVALVFIFYGLYYGVLGRDLSELCTDKIAVHLGYYNIEGIPSKSLPKNICGLCANVLFVSENEQGVIEDTYKLTCDHVFHEFCIRGWLIIGKKQNCPYCKEKVDMSKLFNAWQKPHLLYGQLLDWLRYLLAWQPLILFIVQGINYLFGLE